MKKLIERQRMHFNEITGDYNKAINDNKTRLFRKLVYHELFRNADTERKLKNGGGDVSTLEAMCGFDSGRTLIKGLFGDSKLDYIGFDYSDEVISKVKEKYPNLYFFSTGCCFLRTKSQI